MCCNGYDQEWWGTAPSAEKRFGRSYQRALRRGAAAYFDLVSSTDMLMLPRMRN